jgi:2-dehydro-3-deoxyphosphogluconate aldolase/(4S)-4-hydroxy-2-oxoglutarate aldolase
MQDWLTLLKKERAIAVIRTTEFQQGIHLAQAVAWGGIHLIEITWNSTQPAQLVTQLRQELPDCVIGAGTILNPTQLQEAINCGCQFIFSPHVNPTLIQMATAAEIPIIPGALTPTEIVTAWELGASCVKVFPIGVMGGVTYLKAIQAPLAGIPLIPTGGVTLENAKSFLDAGAVTVGLSSQLFPKPLVAAQDWDGISKRATQLLTLICS